MNVFQNFLHVKHNQTNSNKSNQLFKAQTIFKFTRRWNSSPTITDKKSKKVVVLSGLSGLGKTSISLEIAKKMRDKGVTTEIISNDAVQVYKGLDIGSYKVPQRDREIVPHHLIDIYDSDTVINAGDFFDMAIKKIDEVLERGNVPIIVGATTFYLKWLLFGKQAGPKVPRELENKYYQLCLQDNNWEKSYQRLVDVDPIYAQKVTRNNYQRLCKALSKIELSGKPLHALDVQSSKSEEDFDYDFRPFYLIRPKMDCKRIIDYRVELMLQAGFITEVAKLMKNGLKLEHHATRAIGYKSTMEILLSNRTIDSRFVLNWISEIQSNTRQAATSQMKFARIGEMGETWRWIDMQHFTRFPDPITIENSTINAISDLIIDNLKLSIIEHNSDHYKSLFARPPYIVSSPKEFKEYRSMLKIYNKPQKVMDLVYEFTSARHFVNQQSL